MLLLSFPPMLFFSFATNWFMQFVVLDSVVWIRSDPVKIIILMHFTKSIQSLNNSFGFWIGSLNWATDSSWFNSEKNSLFIYVPKMTKMLHQFGNVQFVSINRSKMTIQFGKLKIIFKSKLEIESLHSLIPETHKNGLQYSATLFFPWH